MPSAGRLALAACLLSLGLYTVVALRRRGKVHILPKIHVCDGCMTTKRTFIVHDVKYLLDSRGGDYVVAEIELTKPMRVIRRVNIIIHRCKEAATQGTCEYFSTWSWSAGLCPLAQANGVIWSPFMHSIVPTFKCPLSTGRYKVHNGSFDLEIMDTLGGSSGLYDHIWMFEAQVFDDTPVSNVCFNCTFQVRRVRERV